MLGKIEFWSINSLIWFLIGMAVLWIIQNGWGKVLAIKKTKETEAKTAADKVYSQITSQVDVALNVKLQPIADGIAELKNIIPRVVLLEQEVKNAAIAAIKPAA